MGDESDFFLDDLYFLKREGNNSVHSSIVKKDGIVALECLQRAFEVAINYAVYHAKADKNILKLRYDTELLVTGKKTPKSLAEKYEQEKAKSSKKSSKKKMEKDIRQSHSMKTMKTPSGRVSLFGYFLLVSSIVSLVLILVILLFNMVQ